VALATIFVYFISSSILYNTFIHVDIHLYIRWGFAIHFLTTLGLPRSPSQDPKSELGPAIQQADALPSEQRNTAPFYA
jgi:hypothetical protein